MKVTVDKDRCIGCGACMAIVDDFFEFGDDGLAEVKEDAIITDENKDDVISAADSCPGAAIIVEE